MLKRIKKRNKIDKVFIIIDKVIFKLLILLNTYLHKDHFYFLIYKISF